MKKKSPEEALRLYAETKKLIDRGIKPSEAMKETGIPGHIYYYHRKKEVSAPVKRKYTKRTKFIDVPVASTPDNSVAVIVCSPSQVKSIIASLQ